MSSYSYLFSSSSSSRSLSTSSVSSSSSSASTAANERVRRISAWSVNPEVQENHGVPTPQGDPEMHDIYYQPPSSQFESRAVVVFLQYSTYSSYWSRNSSGLQYFQGWPDDPSKERPYDNDYYGLDSPLNPCGYDPLFPHVRRDYDWYSGKPDEMNFTLGNTAVWPDWWYGYFSNSPNTTFPQEKVHWFTGVFIWYENSIQEIENVSGQIFKFNFPPHGTDFPLHGGQTNRDNYGPNGYIKMNITTLAGVFQPYKTDTPNLAIARTVTGVWKATCAEIGLSIGVRAVVPITQKRNRILS